jgi:hypothetical protein
MIRLSLAFFYRLGTVVQPLNNLRQDMIVRDVWSALYSAEKELKELLSTDWLWPGVRVASGHGTHLLAAIEAITNRTDFDAQVGFEQANAVTNAVQGFDMVLRTELHIADAYFVTRKAAYDTGVLISNAEKQFPDSLGLKVSESIVDVREAGKCLAFELSTAAGFHILRATESVLRSYWAAVSGGKPHPKPQTIGTYARKLTDLNLGERKVRATLDQINTLHRNPLIHPQESLSLDEAVSLFGICQSAVSAMLKAIPDPPPSSLVSPAAL